MMQTWAFIPKESLKKIKARPCWDSTRSPLKLLQKRAVTIYKVPQNHVLLEISEIEPLVTRWICLDYQTESALGSFILYDYSLYLVVSSLEGLSCNGKALQWESMFKHQFCFTFWMNFKPTVLCVWTPSLQNGME